VYGYRSTNGLPQMITNPPNVSDNLYIQSITRDFLIDDTIQFALHYKKPTNINVKKVAFLYNSHPNRTFIPIDDPRLDKEKLPNALFPNSTLNISQVRLHHSEVPSKASNTFLDNYNSEFETAFQNGIVFEIGTGAQPNNYIFLTLFTESYIDIGENENFKLLYLGDKDNVIESYESNLVNHKGLGSHDPNYEKVIPSCLVYPTDAGKDLNYEVHFQNVGKGPALEIVTTTTLPIGYIFSDVLNFQWQVSNMPNNSRYNVSTRTNANNSLVVQFNKNVATDSILSGTQGMPDPLNNKTTMGGFTFTLKAKQPLLAMPNQLNSFTSIVFDSNPPVLTDSAIIRVRKCCTCQEPSRNGNTKNCKLCRKSKFIKWLFCKDC
jgi:hypothetical protein